MARRFIFINTINTSAPFTMDFLMATGITDATTIAALTGLENDLTTAGIINYANPSSNKIKILYPFVGGSASTHKFNFLDPQDLDASFRLTFYGGWTHNANGITGNGSNAYADIHLNPYSALTSNSYHYGVYCRIDIANSGINDCVYGNYDGMSGDNLFPNFVGNCYSRLSDNDGAVFSTATSKGYYLSVRNSSTNKNIYRNSTKTTVTSSTIGFANYNLFLGAYNQAGIGVAYTTNNIAGFHAGDVLNDTEATALYNAIQAFNTTLGRQV